MERKSRFYIAIPMKDRTKESMHKAIQKLIKSLPKAALKSFTSDRDKEFSCYIELNSRPRKCLNYQTPFEIFLYELSLL